MYDTARRFRVPRCSVVRSRCFSSRNGAVACHMYHSHYTTGTHENATCSGAWTYELYTRRLTHLDPYKLFILSPQPCSAPALLAVYRLLHYLYRLSFSSLIVTCFLPWARKAGSHRSITLYKLHHLQLPLYIRHALFVISLSPPPIVSLWWPSFHTLPPFLVVKYLPHHLHLHDRPNSLPTHTSLLVSSCSRSSYNVYLLLIIASCQKNSVCLFSELKLLVYRVNQCSCRASMPLSFCSSSRFSPRPPVRLGFPCAPSIPPLAPVLPYSTGLAPLVYTVRFSPQPLLSDGAFQNIFCCTIDALSSCGGGGRNASGRRGYPGEFGDARS
jgi:hypothetical protein